MGFLLHYYDKLIHIPEVHFHADVIGASAAVTARKTAKLFNFFTRQFNEAYYRNFKVLWPLQVEVCSRAKREVSRSTNAPEQLMILQVLCL